MLQWQCCESGCWSPCLGLRPFWLKALVGSFWWNDLRCRWEKLGRTAHSRWPCASGFAFHHIRGWSRHRCYPRRRLDLIHQSRCQTSEAFGTKPLGTFGPPRSALHSGEASYRFGLPQPGKLRASSCRRELPNYFQWRTSTPWAWGPHQRFHHRPRYPTSSLRHEGLARHGPNGSRTWSYPGHGRVLRLCWTGRPAHGAPTTVEGGCAHRPVWEDAMGGLHCLPEFPLRWRASLESVRRVCLPHTHHQGESGPQSSAPHPAPFPPAGSGGALAPGGIFIECSEIQVEFDFGSHADAEIQPNPAIIRDVYFLQETIRDVYFLQETIRRSSVRRIGRVQEPVECTGSDPGG